MSNNKKLVEYEKSHPVQLSLFQMLDREEASAVSRNRHNPYSQSIELYDAMPKYVSGKQKVNANEKVEILKREFEFRGEKRILKIRPAVIEDSKTGTVQQIYPGRREEIVEEVLRKLAVEGGGVFLDDKAAITFSVWQIRQELAKHKHNLSYTQVIESLMILSLTRMELQSADQKRTAFFSPIERMVLSTKEDGKETFVVLAPIVTDSIKSLNFRLYNYDTVMRYSSVIARRLHKRLAHHFIQASILNKYSIFLTTLVRDFGLTVQSSLSKNLQKVELAIQEMVKEDVVLNYSFKDKVYESSTNKLLDVKIEIQPTMQFVKEVTKANAVVKRNKEIAVEKNVSIEAEEMEVLGKF